MKITKNILLVLALSLGPLSSYSATPYQDSVLPQKRLTADSQRIGSDRDVELTRKLRAALMADNQLSTQAQNINIITITDSIILRGHVASRAEKIKIENLARARAGNKKVYNRLTY